ncbi:hypothetical protein CIW48_12950 [Methylobacterium sp. P1-11]|nr:hypothetical protein CIW48_12950 [Methylobacterium sp. P1-11]
MSRSGPQAVPLRLEVPMAQDQSGGANPSAAERAAAERVARKRLGSDGCPEPVPDPRDPAEHACGIAAPEPASSGQRTPSVRPVEPRSMGPKVLARARE